MKNIIPFRRHRAGIAGSIGGIAILFWMTAVWAPSVHALPPEGDIVAGTSLAGELVERLMGPPVSVRPLLPPNMCPGHYDVRPGDIAALAACRLLVLQPWQRDMPNVASAIRAAKLPESRVCVVPAPGNWMLPALRAGAARAAADRIGEVWPERAGALMSAAEAIAADSIAAGAREKARLDACGVGGIKALCNEQQEAFARWAGIDVVGTFGRAEGMSMGRMKALISRARESKAALVIDNLQSGDAKTGEALARGTGAAHVVLTNFPGSETGADTWEATLHLNVDRLLAAIAQWRGGHG
ncbi:MAG TPA: zinc ABC transporter substrate-binding protein [Candidatus Hydrogenedentes bacterium]|nr:zinc ABC transporter substrate-binding protein [Candidatus Hydrogenedentota bacterium]HOV74496.1 zinc ABC transporter substrate-binding protein [Candidatus Hydrogenedentota bacterium]HPC18066.1 zinc ABC transporter substrate-binding protein [Candidatus Hydrogenedentota bacterium]HRT21956.1 zinc ABC transporter substrate-binding protein [Candidatus Hydrogenedentota bacterium]HRT66517.1 zinc ABC transporter substrate-binding protein [Candidatus Hydrogenedentota bacterium]